MQFVSSQPEKQKNVAELTEEDDFWVPDDIEGTRILLCNIFEVMQYYMLITIMCSSGSKLHPRPR